MAYFSLRYTPLILHTLYNADDRSLTPVIAYIAYGIEQEASQRCLCSEYRKRLKTARWSVSFTGEARMVATIRMNLRFQTNARAGPV